MSPILAALEFLLACCSPWRRALFLLHAVCYGAAPPLHPLEAAAGRLCSYSDCVFVAACVQHLGVHLGGSLPARVAAERGHVVVT